MSDKIKNLDEIVEFKGKKIKYGRCLFNKCLPEDYEVIDEPVDGKVLNKILNDLVLKYPANEVADCMDKIKSLGFNFSTYEGYTLSLDDLYVVGLGQYRKDLKDNDIENNMRKMSNPEIINKIKNKKFALYIESGARGSWDQVKQLVFSRGHVADANNKIRPELIKSSLLGGLNRQEFFNSCWGARKGLLDTALSTGAAGYLSRQLIYSTVNMELNQFVDDCATKDGLVINLKNKSKEQCETILKSLLWRWRILEDDSLELITVGNYNNLIGTEFKIKSPVFCKSKKVCMRCYGNLHRCLHSDQIGLIAAQAIGERSVQLVLRSFHTSIKSTDEVIDVNNNSYPIEEVYKKVKSGEDFYTFSCSPEGEIEVCKVIDAHADHITNKMIKITLDDDSIVNVTPEHKMMMRDGTYKEAKNLSLNDSLMPIKIYNEHIYRSVKPNNKNKKFPTRIYTLSAKHKDSEASSIVLNENYHIHHKDKNQRNDSPKNLTKLTPQNHYEIHKENIISAVKESNSRRMQNPIFRENHIAKKKQIWQNPALRKQVSNSKKQYFKNNPNEGKRLIYISRKKAVEKIIDKIKEESLPLTNESYINIRDEYFATTGHLTFDYAIDMYPELFVEFEMVSIYKKSKEQLFVETCMDKILNKMNELNLNMTITNFIDTIGVVYTRYNKPTIEGLLKYSPLYLDQLENDYVEPIKKSREQLQNESRMDKILEKMNELNMEMALSNFDKANDILYPGIYSRRKRESLLKYSSDYLNHLENDITPEIEKTKQQLHAESRIQKIIDKMLELDMEMTLSNFDKANEIVYSHPNTRHSRNKMISLSPDYLDDKILNNHYVKNIEFIELEKEEVFYDLTVDSQYSNFPLKSGIFVHNSGLALGDGADEDNDDIIGGIGAANKILHKPESLLGEKRNPEILVNLLYELFSQYGNLHMIHYEVIIAAMMWNGNKYWRLITNRDTTPVEYVSIMQIPSRSSWLLGAAFSNVKKKLLEGLVHDKIDSGSSLTNLFKF